MLPDQPPGRSDKAPMVDSCLPFNSFHRSGFSDGKYPAFNQEMAVSLIGRSHVAFLDFAAESRYVIHISWNDSKS